MNWPECAKDEEAFDVPEGLDDAAKARWMEISSKISSDYGTMKNISATIIAQNPEAYAEFVRQTRVETIKKMAACLSRCDNFLRKDLSFIREVLSFPTDEVGGILQAIHALGASPDLDPDEVQEVVNRASVLSVMEEGDGDDEEVTKALPRKMPRKTKHKY